PRTRQPASAPATLPKTGLHQGQLRFTPHGSEWSGCARFHRFPSPPLHRPQIQCSFPDAEKRSAQSLRRLFDDGLRISECVRLGLLCDRFVPADPSSYPRRLEFFPIARSERQEIDTATRI